MKIFKKKCSIYFLLILFTFCLHNCASKKNISSKQKITIKSKKDNISDKNILYIVDGKEVSSEYIKTMNPNMIHSLTIIKGKKDIKKYTDKEYDGVILIKMK